MRGPLHLSIETIYVLALALLNIGTCYLVLSYGFYGSAVLFKPLDHPDASVSNLLIVLTGYALLSLLVISQAPRRPRQMVKPQKRIDTWYSIIIAVNWAIFLTTGIGVAGTSAQSMGFLVNMLPIAPLMLIYFAARHDFNNAHYTLNLISGTLLIMLRGWSAIVIMMMIIHVFAFIKVVNAKNAPRIALTAILTVLGYNYLYILKYYIREGILFDSNFLIAAEYALSRVTAFQNFDYFSSIIPEFVPHMDGESFFYLKEFFLAFFPKSLIGYDNYKPLDNIFATQFVAAGLEGMDATGFAITLPGVFRLACELNPVNYVLFPAFILGLYRLIYNLCSTIWSDRIKYYFVVTTLNLYYSGNMREFAFSIYALMIYISLRNLPLYSLRKTVSTKIDASKTQNVTPSPP